MTRASRTRSSVWKVSDKRPGLNYLKLFDAQKKRVLNIIITFNIKLAYGWLWMIFYLIFILGRL